MVVSNGILTLFKCRQLFATASRDSSEIFLQFVMFRPWSRTAFSASANIERSVIESRPVTSKARRLRLPWSIAVRLRSVSLTQLVKVKRSTRLQVDKGCNVPSLISGAYSGLAEVLSMPLDPHTNADRFSRLIRLG